MLKAGSQTRRQAVHIVASLVVHEVLVRQRVMRRRLRQQKTEHGVRLRIQNNRQQMIDVNTQEVLVEADNVAMVPNQSALAPEIIQAFNENPKLHEPMIFDAGHPDEDGYALMAKTVAQWVKKNRWLPEGRGENNGKTIE